MVVDICVGASFCVLLGAECLEMFSKRYFSRFAVKFYFQIQLVGSYHLEFLFVARSCLCDGDFEVPFRKCLWSLLMRCRFGACSSLNNHNKNCVAIVLCLIELVVLPQQSCEKYLCVGVVRRASSACFNKKIYVALIEHLHTDTSLHLNLLCVLHQQRCDHSTWVSFPQLWNR